MLHWQLIGSRPGEEIMPKLQAGDTAPSFSLQDQTGATVSLVDFAGKMLLVYFYPRADTPGCTKQACSVRDARPDLTTLGIAAVGISPDTPDRQQKFDKKYDLGFPLLSDPDHAVAEAWNVWGEKKNYGKTSMGIKRSSFLIDGDGRIVRAWYGVKPLDTVTKAIEALDAG
jgi:thioredoxin-dependent peroxiredoxin